MMAEPDRPADITLDRDIEVSGVSDRISGAVYCTARITMEPIIVMIKSNTIGSIPCRAN